eukprot:Nk52_evm6s2062 gene=Nk52_evmTU6s2062
MVGTNASLRRSSWNDDAMSRLSSQSIMAPPRFVKIASGDCEVEIPISVELWQTSEQLSRDFHRSLGAQEGWTEIQLISRFMKFVTDYHTQDHHLSVKMFLKEVFVHYRNLFMKGNFIHAVVAAHDVAYDDKVNIIQTHYQVVSALNESGMLLGEESSEIPALLKAVQKRDASIMVLFGGQGIENCIEELKHIYETYEEAKEFIKRMCEALFNQAASCECKDLGFHSEGLNIIQWLENADSVPASNYLISAPVSFPVIGLTQLAHYFVMLKVLDMAPVDILSMLSGTTGHSQGIVSSLVIASSLDMDSFIANSEKALVLLFWLGSRLQEAYPPVDLSPVCLQDSLEHDEGVPTPMLLIKKLPKNIVEAHVANVNKHLPTDRSIEISLVNGPRSIVVSGPPQSLHGLNVALRKLKTQPGESQARVPFSKRKHNFTTKYLPVSAPFHSRYMKNVPDVVSSDINRLSLQWDSLLNIPVYSTFDGSDLRECLKDVTLQVVDLICTKQVMWERATSVDVTHMLDFGPGESIGVGSFTQSNKDGTGTQVILAGSMAAVGSEMLNMSCLYNIDASSVKYAPNWGKEFSPSLIKCESTGKVYVDTRMTRLLGKPHVMVAGMTPTTVSGHFVSACMNAGYHVELAGGGHYNEKALRSKVAEIMENVPAGEGITLNILFLNARQWGFQYPLVKKMRQEGIPIEGICVAAGVPSLENANSIIASLQETGIKHVSFKPGSKEAILDVVKIATSNPSMPIILQWTGGRAGGHHSFEDFHQPILQTYGAIRKAKNIVLVAGSGMGDADGSYPYLTGSWSTDFDFPAMPFDGILVGSRMMVAAEAATSSAVKEYLANQTPGISDEKDWEKTYTGTVGGVTTVVSELGEPIHKVATKGVLLWKDLDEKIFKLPANKQMEALQKNRSWIISRLNSEYSKVYFGRKLCGRVCELSEMTYSEVCYRLIQLLFVESRNDWIDPSFQNLVGDFVERTEERFCSEEKVAFLQVNEDITRSRSPRQFVERFFEYYPAAKEQLLTTEDVLYFLSLCKRRGQKPVPFIPILNEDFKVYFKKDSLWQSENLDAIVGQDVQRVCILHGPVAAKYCKTANEPAKDILDSIAEGHIKALQDSLYERKGKDVPCIPYIGLLGKNNGTRSIPKHISVASTGSMIQFTLPSAKSKIPELNEWVSFLAGSKESWLHALLMSPFIVQDKMRVNNAVTAIIKPRLGQIVRLEFASGKVTSNGEGFDRASVKSLKIFDSTMTARAAKNKKSSGLPFPAVDITYDGEKDIVMKLNEPKNDDVCSLKLMYRYLPSKGYAPIHEITAGKNIQIKNFYCNLWFGCDLPTDPLNGEIEWLAEDKFSCSKVVQRVDILKFCAAVGNQSEAYVQFGNEALEAPMDFAIVLGWEAVIKSIFPGTINGNLLRLVHLSNSFVMKGGKRRLCEGDVVFTEAEIRAVENLPDGSGKRVAVKGILMLKDGTELMEITSQFLYRGRFKDFENTFKKTDHEIVDVHLKDAKSIAILKGKDWIVWDESKISLHELVPGSTLRFHLHSFYKFKNCSTYSSVKTGGIITFQKETKEIVKVATVLFECGVARGNPVLSYLERNGSPVTETVYFENGGYSVLPKSDAFSNVVQAPATNEHYAYASGDLNPIHVNPYIADYSELPGPITHGMWSSASTRRILEIFAADNHAHRVHSYEVNFVGMVLPGDKIEAELNHIGMKNGRKVIKVKCVNQHMSTVLEGIAEVEQPLSAYTFTGQGSQEQGMGMDLYDKSPAAKRIWDAADKRFRETYGVSIIEIVRQNPKTKTVYFGGSKGSQIRQNFMSMTYDVFNDDGSRQTVSLFPSITENTQSFTFSHPNGLLSATQFTQPALVLFEKAAFEDMSSKGLVPTGCQFAGHSLGEYAALASIGDVLPIESLVDVVFYRGMTMQCAVPRNSDGRSNYGMVAVNPLRVGKGFGEVALTFICDTILNQSKELIEIVNYNVENWQYVVAGEIVNLETLANVLNFIFKEKINLENLLESYSIDFVKDELIKIVDKCLVLAKAKKAENDGILSLSRGIASIPLPGIDVPFHSRFLLSGVAPFRQYLSKRLSPSHIDVNLLTNRYIPNLTAIPFSISLEYVQHVFDMTQSPKLKSVLKSLDGQSTSTLTNKEQQELGYTLLIELLAYQFASPVQWIKTQDQLFAEFAIERLIEVGPSPVLCGMAKRTLGLKYAESDEATMHKREILCFGKDHEAIVYDYSNSSEEPAAVASEPSPVMQASPPVPLQASPASVQGPIPDAPVKAVDIVTSIVANKLKKKVEDVPLAKSIKELVAGKSTMQNELIGDLSKEFGAGALPSDRGEEMSLKELSDHIASSFNGGLGPYLNAAVSKLISSKMPAGFPLSKVKSYLSTEKGLGEGHIDGVLVLSLSLEPSSRLASEQEAKTWIDSVFDAYCKKSGISPVSIQSAPQQVHAASPNVMPSMPVVVPDFPVSALHVLRVVIADKLKKSIEEVGEDKSIKSLVGGKSTAQNEILGDIQQEFGSSSAASDSSAAEIPLKDLSAALASSYSKLGAYTNSRIAKLYGSKMPPGFTLSAIKSHLGSSFGLQEGRIEGVLLYSILLEPTSRFTSEMEAKTWLESVVSKYSQFAGFQVSSGASGGAVPSVPMGVNSAALDAFEMRHSKFIKEQISLYSQYINEDPRAGFKLAEAQEMLTRELQFSRDLWLAEHGEVYENGIKPKFTTAKVRQYDSFWNWVRQDAIELHHDILYGRLTAVDRAVSEKCLHVINRGTTEVLDMIKYHVMKAQANPSDENEQTLAELGDYLRANVEEGMDLPPMYRDLYLPTAPSVSVDENGAIEYEEVNRAEIRKLEHYAEELVSGGKQILGSQIGALKEHIKAYKKLLKSKNVDNLTKARIRVLLRQSKAGILKGTKDNQDKVPLIHLKRQTKQDVTSWEYSKKLTSIYLGVVKEVATQGVSFEGKTVLMTGCGRGSIGVDILKALLAGGAHVIATTSSFSKSTTGYYQDIYTSSGGKGSCLTLVPFNQGSLQDVNSLMNYIYTDKDGLKADLDYVIPFAAISENGRELSDIDGRSELAHRIMLTNLHRILGAIKTKKAELGYDTRPAQVVIPLSPNHGIFGGDGLYAESKMSLEALFYKWKSESWGPYLTIAGAVIGWTRGTGLMSSNDLVAEGVERLGVRTFSTREMAFNIICLMHQTMANLSQTEPLWADLTGGMNAICDLKAVTSSLRSEILHDSEVKAAVQKEKLVDVEVISGKPEDKAKIVKPRANIKCQFPELKSYEEIKRGKEGLHGMLELEKVVVVTGYGEVGPWGNSKTRWEMEANGEFSLEGCIQMAWMMGLIEHFEGKLPSGSQYSGWIDSKTKEPVKDFDVKRNYEKNILQHTGVRIIEPELFDGYNPDKKQLLHQVAIDHDLHAIEMSEEEAFKFKHEHGDLCEVFKNDQDQWMVQLKRGAVLYVPKALKFDRFVAGQIPTGWSAERYGVPKDICEQVDPVTLFNLVSTVEALVSSGITDPYEFYEYVHVSGVGNCSGGGVGGLRANIGMYRDRLLDNQVQGDILQENFINTMPAWVNLLLLSSSGPIKTPVGACATAVESIELGLETILSGKAKVVICGGYDDFTEHSSYEFASMKATSSAVDEVRKGREPSEMSRPTTTSRGGFMESQGAGNQILMSADLAITMGVPIYGIVALTNTATDKEGRSVPAPGQGILTTARELKKDFTHVNLTVPYRRRQVLYRMKQIDDWVEHELALLQDEASHLFSKACEYGDLTKENQSLESFLKQRTEEIHDEARRKKKSARYEIFMNFYTGNDSISPLTGALAVYGLTIDDIDVASFHGTGTKANDKNESEVVNRQLHHLGRSRGNPVFSIFQKYLTGHPKGAAAAWMLNGVLQCMQHRFIPGNRNADNIDPELRKFTHIFYPSKAIEMKNGIRAGIVKSFGFGQVGGECVVINPDYLYASLDEEDYTTYRAKCFDREAVTYKYLHDSLLGHEDKGLVRVKTSPPYTASQEQAVYLDPNCRASYDCEQETWSFRKSPPTPLRPVNDLSGNGHRNIPDLYAERFASEGVKALNKAMLAMSGDAMGPAALPGQGVGVDVELISAINIENPVFLERNFTGNEIDYCRQAPDSAASFCGRWCAKEAIIKAITNCDVNLPKKWEGAGAGLKDIEIVSTEGGAPKVRLHGKAKDVASEFNVQEEQIKVSISHSGEYATSLAMVTMLEQ